MLDKEKMRERKITFLLINVRVSAAKNYKVFELKTEEIVLAHLSLSEMVRLHMNITIISPMSRCPQIKQLYQKANVFDF